MLARFKDWYFPPRAFEAGRLYPLLGVRLFKKYLPTSGDLVSRRRGIRRVDVARAGSRRAALLGYEQQARRWEYGHLVSALLLQAWAVVGGLVVSPVQFWVCTGINLVVNLYPVMLQRYNRARVARLLAADAGSDDASGSPPLRGVA